MIMSHPKIIASFPSVMILFLHTVHVETKGASDVSGRANMQFIIICLNTLKILKHIMKWFVNYIYLERVIQWSNQRWKLEFECLFRVKHVLTFKMSAKSRQLQCYLLLAFKRWTNNWGDTCFLLRDCDNVPVTKY